MRIRFSCSLSPDTGKQNFAIRLAREFKNHNIKIVNKNPDINLVFVKGIIPGCINILRLDNAWFNNKMNSEAKNSSIRRTMKKCNAVIYQGEYSRLICRHFIGIHNKYCIIPNGCNEDEFLNPYVHVKPYILAVSRWRPHKRLKEIVLGFLNSGLKDNFDLIVCGKPDFVTSEKSVIYLGTVSNKKVCKLMAGCFFSVHLAFMDCCPNSVVEALVCGKPVLYTNSGGLKELVGQSGFCVSDVSFEYKMIDLYNPPALKMEELVTGYRYLAAISTTAPRQDLYIRNISRKYIDFFKTITNK